MQENPLNRVFLITGSDLCRSMANWRAENIAHAIIVTRGTGDCDTIPQTDFKGKITSLVYQPTGEPFATTLSTEEKSRTLLLNAFPEYECYSSTAIRSGKLKVEYV